MDHPFVDKVKDTRNRTCNIVRERQECYSPMNQVDENW